MIITASNGCLLTQSEDVAIKDRRFEKVMMVASMAEAARWKEIPESERDKIIAEANLFEPERVDYAYLGKVNNLLTVIGEKINNASLSPNEALEMQQYYPEWENCIGKYAPAGFRCNHLGTLVEVVTSHVLSADNPPVQAPMLLMATSADANADAGQDDAEAIPQPEQVQYFKPVEPQRITHVKYSSSPDGSPMTDTPSAYIGTYEDYTDIDSTNPADYTWTAYEQGHPDPVGEQGTNGSDLINDNINI